MLVAVELENNMTPTHIDRAFSYEGTVVYCVDGYGHNGRVSIEIVGIGHDDESAIADAEGQFKERYVGGRDDRQSA